MLTLLAAVLVCDRPVRDWMCETCETWSSVAVSRNAISDTRLEKDIAQISKSECCPRVTVGEKDEEKGVGGKKDWIASVLAVGGVRIIIRTHIASGIGKDTPQLFRTHQKKVIMTQELDRGTSLF